MSGGFRRRYGASPGHLLALAVGGAVSAYAVSRISDVPTLVSIAVWFGFLLVAHDLLLFPVYALADRLVSRTAPARWTNHVRVPAMLSGLLLLAWFPLVLRLSAGYEHATTRSPEPFLWRWLAVTAGLFATSALVLVIRTVRAGHRR